MSGPEPGCPSPFFRANAERLRAAARIGPVLDVACGRGRHAIAAAELGARVVAIDRNAASLAALDAIARRRELPVHPLRSDLETPDELPLRPGAFGAVLVFRFLFRPLAGALAAALRPGGLLLYETFTLHQRQLGSGPHNPAFLLRAGELAGLFRGLEILDSDEGLFEGPPAQHLARLAARRPPFESS